MYIYDRKTKAVVKDGYTNPNEIEFDVDLLNENAGEIRYIACETMEEKEINDKAILAEVEAAFEAETKAIMATL